MTLTTINKKKKKILEALVNKNFASAKKELYSLAKGLYLCAHYEDDRGKKEMCIQEAEIYVSIAKQIDTPKKYDKPKNCDKPKMKKWDF